MKVSRTNSKALACLVPALAAPFATSITTFAQDEYVVTDLGALVGSHTYPFAINTSGKVVGMSVIDGLFAKPFLWTDGEMIELPTFGGEVSESGAADIRDDDVIVGWSATTQFHVPPFDANQIIRPFLFVDGRITQLDALIDEGSAVARAINNDGWIVGWGHSVFDGFSIQSRALLWIEGELTDLGTLGGATSGAWDINDAGQIVGGADNPNGNDRAFLWQDGVMTDITPFETNQANGRSINQSGQVIGIYRFGPDIRSFMWDDGEGIDLGTLGGPYTEAFAINNAGEIVGASSTATELHGFLWRDGEMVDINAAAPELPLNFVGRGINDDGRIIGSAFDPADLRAHAYLLEPLNDGGDECVADLDDDGAVGTSDLLALLGAWGTNPKGAPDLDGDGVVGTPDLLLLLGAWGPC